MWREWRERTSRVKLPTSAKGEKDIEKKKKLYGTYVHLIRCVSIEASVHGAAYKRQFLNSCSESSEYETVREGGRGGKKR